MPEEKIVHSELKEFDPESKKLLEEAQTLYNDFVTGRMRAGNLPGERDRSPRGQAIDRTLKVMEKYPDDPRPLFLYGTILHSMNELPEAEAVLKRALSTKYSTFILHRLLAEILLERGAYEEIGQHLDKMMEFDKTRPEIYEIMAEVAERKGENQKRLDALEKVMGILPNDARFGLSWALTKARMGKLDEAIKKLEELVEFVPDNAEVQFHLANLYVDKERYTESLALYKRVLEISPDHHMARFELADLLDEMNRPQESLDVYREYLQIIKEDPDAWYNAAGVAERMENHALAVEYYLQFLRFTGDPIEFEEVIEWLNENAPGNYDEGELQIGIARAYMDQNEPESALREIAIARGMDVDNRRINMIEGLAQAELEEFEESYRLLEKAMEFDDFAGMEGFTDDDILIAGGESLLEMGEYDKAAGVAKEIIKGESKAEDGYTLLGDIELEKENRDSAYDYFKKALAANMFSFGGYFGLGEIYDLREKYSFAATSFRLCLEIEKDDPDSLYRLGMNYMRLGFKEWGKFYLKMYLEIESDGEYVEDIKKVL